MFTLRGFVAAVMLWATSVAMVGAQNSQDVVWVQIESYSAQQIAERRAAIYSDKLEDVNAFRMGGGWYALLLGPYTRADARQVLNTYRREGLIPRDSFIARTSALQSQFWPVGVDLLGRGTLSATAPAAPSTAPQEETATAAVETPQVQIPDETPAQARASERALNRGEREALQIALKWAGFYTAAIDGAFGRGTRASMAAWQAANGHEDTGTLTTAQRAELLGQYNAVLDGLGLAQITDTTAGVGISMPQDVVTFGSYEYPFAKYRASGDIPAQVLLISQAGDQAALVGLYDVMQTLEIVPLNGARSQSGNAFTLIGENSEIVSHTEATLKNGEIKGFTLIWPAGDEERRTRLLAEMQASLTRTDGVLDPSWSDTEAQAIDLVAGLQVRTPRVSRSGFFVNTQGAVVTSGQTVEGCTQITLDGDVVAVVAAQNTELGMAVLKPQTALAPLNVAQLAKTPARLQSDAVLGGYSFGGVLNTPSVTFGALADHKGLRGEDTLARLELESLEGDAGGPVLDETGALIGMLLPREETGRSLPETVRFAANSSAIGALLAEADVSVRARDSQNVLAPEDVAALARDVTVLVSCWD